MTEEPRPTEPTSAARLIGLIGGSVVAASILATDAPPGLDRGGWIVVALGALMALWWMTEAIPLAATALLPLVLLPLLGAADLGEVTPAYADPLIFLFLGGFLIAQALQRWGFDRRVAAVLLDRFGGRPAGTIGAVMAATAFLSLWISNTATAMAMLPIGQSIIAGMRRHQGSVPASAIEGFSAALMLGIAYAATIGGMGSLIGSPPNALFAAYLREAHGIDITFAQWLAFGLPAVAILLPLAWLLLTKLLYRTDLRDLAAGGGAAITPEMPASWSRGEAATAGIFALAATAWIARPMIQALFPGVTYSDAGVAMVAALLLFVIPVGGGRPVLTWSEATQLPWGVLILFGGGLALAGQLETHGVAGWIGSAVHRFASLPPVLLALLVATVIVLLGELASNTAVAAVFLPIAGAAALGLGLSPISLPLAVALAASIGFMLPVATPPNAIVFGSGAVRSTEMLRAGAILDLIGVAVVTVIAALMGDTLPD